MMRDSRSMVFVSTKHAILKMLSFLILPIFFGIIFAASGNYGVMWFGVLMLAICIALIVSRLRLPVIEIENDLMYRYALFGIKKCIGRVDQISIIENRNSLYLRVAEKNDVTLKKEWFGGKKWESLKEFLYENTKNVSE